ncbi:MAG TPA: TonB-dependent receptor plug domain-containing protein, partial [Gammaproteobacteria bacterium]|nr:TonB-dependent receptor plug domain-containing protein [Gammaproteobacteria bacterium]
MSSKRVGRRAARRPNRFARSFCLGALVAGMSLGSAAQEEQGAASPASAADPLETIVVSASRARQRLADAPAAVTVLSSAELRQLPWDDYGDLLRTVPGVNVAQTGVRDINVTARGATSTLSTSQLLLLDGRSMYLDFFGFVMWDLLPVQPAEIDRIEVVRGPGSAVWGANAMTGVVNVITKRPKDMPGTTLVVGTPYANVVHAGAAGKLAYRVSAGYFEQSAYERPTGVVPGSVPPQSYPGFENRDTQQRRFDARMDYDLTGDSFVSVSGGYADTAGILESGIGPFDIARGSGLSYLKADWNAGAAHVGFYGNFLRGDATNLLTLGATGSPLSFHFTTDTYDLEMSDSSRAGTRHTLTYGADFRKSDFELGIAPAASGRQERGAFLQD